jgi:hypothetical protein
MSFLFFPFIVARPTSQLLIVEHVGEHLQAAMRGFGRKSDRLVKNSNYTHNPGSECKRLLTTVDVQAHNYYM